MYDMLSPDYDRFVNWQDRLRYEMPFLRQQLLQAGIADLPPGWILDAACGTGWHAIAFAQDGYQAIGTDLSEGMVEQARHNALAVNVDVPFHQAGFGDISQQLTEIYHKETEPGCPLPGNINALICLGNSLPHLLNAGQVQHALKDFSELLRPGGILIIQNRNFDAVMEQRSRWMEPQSARDEAGREWIFLRFYDFEPDGLIQFNLVKLARSATGGVWEQTPSVTRLYPLKKAELSVQLATVGFVNSAYYGDMAGSRFDEQSSGNLIVVAQKKG